MATADAHPMTRAGVRSRSALAAIRVSRRLLAACALSTAALAAEPARAEVTPAGRTAFSFEQIEAGARGTGFGGAFTAISDDATAISWNPAGLTRIPSFEALIGYNLWFQEVGETSIHLGQSRGPMGFGLAASFLSIPSDVRVDAGGVAKGSFAGRAFGARAAGAYAFGAASIGLAVGVDSETLDRTSVSGVNATLGALYDLSPLRFGLSLQRAGPPVAGAAPPTDLRLGAAWLGSVATASLELHKPLDHALRVVAGGEWRPADFAALRAGYRAALGAGPGLSAMSGFSGGFGLRTLLTDYALTLDYAFWPMGELGPTHRMTLSLRPKTATSHGATAPVADPPRALETAPATLAIAERDGEIVVTWPPSSDRAVVGYQVYAALGSEAPKRITGTPVTGSSFRLKRPSAPSGTVVHAWVRAVDRKGNELIESPELTLTLR